MQIKETILGNTSASLMCLEWVLHFLILDNQPDTLKECSRTAVLNSLDSDAVDTFPIPTTLKKYLKFERGGKKPATKKRNRENSVDGELTFRIITIG